MIVLVRSGAGPSPEAPDRPLQKPLPVSHGEGPCVHNSMISPSSSPGCGSGAGL